MKSRVITFHSYKGGAGRSSTTINTLPYIVKAFNADAQHPILLIDMDLDSAGMTYLLNCNDHFNHNFDTKKFLIGSEFKWSDGMRVDDYTKHPLLSKFLPVGSELGVEDKSVLFLGVNDMLKYDNDQMAGAKEDLIKKLSNLCGNNGYPAIVLDSASGDQFAALIATKKANVIVSCMRPTFQFTVGTFNYLKRHSLESDASKYILLPTVVPVKDVAINGRSQRDATLSSIKRRIADLYGDQSTSGTPVSIDQTFITPEVFGINEVQRFKWREGVLHYIQNVEGTKLEPDELEASKRYELLANTIKKISEE